jgi:hypothetical protein
LPQCFRRFFTPCELFVLGCQFFAECLTCLVIQILARLIRPPFARFCQKTQIGTGIALRFDFPFQLKCLAIPSF